MPRLETTDGKLIAEISPLPPGSSPPITLWLSLSRPNGGGVHMRVTLDDSDEDRWIVTDVYAHGPNVTASDLQSAPLTQLDLTLNLVGGFDPFTMAEAFEQMGQKILIDPEDEPTLAELRSFAEDAPAALPVIRQPERPKLTRPDGTDPEGFAQRVADAYREYVMQTRSPALKIAEEAGVPVATVRSWIREARRRGKLPEGRKGRAG